MIPFNIPYQNPNLWNDMHVAEKDPRLFRNQGYYYQQAKNKLSQFLNTSNIYLTPSCTHALEIIAHILEIKPGDEIILPSYTYVSTANPFYMKGANLVFADVLPNHPSLDISDVEKKINPKTKAIVLVHYGGIGVDVDAFRKLADQNNILLIEDAAHAIGALYQNKPLGTFGDFAAFSFHETKNLGCVQGGALVVNNPDFVHKANTITQCGTNRLDFMNKKTDRYNWVSPGTNGILAEPLCAILSSQLNFLHHVTKHRLKLWYNYFDALKQIMNKRNIYLMHSPESNGHIFFILLNDAEEKNRYIHFMLKNNIEVTSHYQALHLSPFYIKHHASVQLNQTLKFHNTLIRLPLFQSLSEMEQTQIIELTLRFLNI